MQQANIKISTEKKLTRLEGQGQNMSSEYQSWLDSLNFAHGQIVDTQKEMASVLVKVGEEADLDRCQIR